jgi:aminoglycoside phosphotransferase (APT) family kinase protein
MDAESRLVEGLYGWVSFSVPKVAGHAPLPQGGKAFVHRAPSGTALDAARLAAAPALAAGLGRTLAVIHDLPTRLVADVEMPVYSAEEYRQRRLAEVDRAAGTGHVPSRLLSRWEQALERATAWRFVPTVVHGELDGDSALVEGNEVSGIVDWAQARVADPADDFAWLANALEPELFQTVLGAYTAKRRTTPDPDLADRARLAGELSLARWLLHGTSTDDAEVVADARAMLDALSESIGDATPEPSGGSSGQPTSESAESSPQPDDEDRRSPVSLTRSPSA